MTDAPSISESHNLSQALLQGSALLAPKGHQPHGAIATPYVLALHQKQTAFHILRQRVNHYAHGSLAYCKGNGSMGLISYAHETR
jgi:hypothetical protein